MLRSRPIRLAVLLSTCVVLPQWVGTPVWAQGAPTPPGAVATPPAPKSAPGLLSAKSVEPTAPLPANLAPLKPAEPTSLSPPTLGSAVRTEPMQSSAPSAGAILTPAIKSKVPAPLKLAPVSKDPRPTLASDTFIATLRAADRYRQIAEAGGWPLLPAGATLKVGDKSPVVGLLRQHLSTTLDLPSDAPPGDVFDAKVVAAVKSFQARHGLPETGLVGPKTVQALNVPAEVRFRQLAQSALRLSGSKFPFGERYAVVNIPSAAVEVVQGGQVV